MKTPCVRISFGMNLDAYPLEVQMPRLEALANEFQDEGCGTRLTQTNATAVLEIVDLPTGADPLEFLEGLYFYRWININYSEVERTEE